jgi:hypothetical protein
MASTAISSAKFDVLYPDVIGRSAVYSRYNNGPRHCLGTQNTDSDIFIIVCLAVSAKACLPSRSLAIPVYSSFQHARYNNFSVIRDEIDIVGVDQFGHEPLFS